MMLLVYLSLAVSIPCLYFLRRYTALLLCFIALLTNLFMLDSFSDKGDVGQDLGIVVTIVTLLICAIKNPKILSFKGDLFALFIYVFLAFYWLECLLTIITGVEDFAPSIKVVRKPLLLLSYFIFRTIPLKYQKRALWYMLYITIAQGILFILQFLNIPLLAGFNEDLLLESGYLFNIPTFTFFFFYFCLRMRINKEQRLLLFFFCFLMMLLTGVRGILVAAFISLFVYAVLSNSRKQIILISVLFLLIIPIGVLSIGKKTAMYSTSFQSDISTVLSSGFSADSFQRGSSGTFTFRIAMLAERWAYLVENPKYFLTGVGTIHEDSPNCYNRFNFLLGTRNEDREYGQCIIESGDISWVPITLRYGLIGVLLHLSFFAIIIGMTIKRKDCLRMISVLYLFYFLMSFDSTFFENPIEFFKVGLFMAIVTRCNLLKTQFIF